MKGPQYLIRALPEILKRVPDTTLVLVGSDYHGYQSYLKRLADNLDVSKSIRFTGPIYDTDEKMQAYAACDVFCLPSGYEGTSQSIFQAMAQGKPIVASAVGGIPFQVEDKVEGILVPYRDSMVISESISMLLGDVRLARKMGQAAREKVKGFCYDRLARQMIEIYREAITESHETSTMQ